MPQENDAAETQNEITENKQQTLYFTLSLYADQDRVRAAFGAKVDWLTDPDNQLSIQRKYRKSLDLRDAIEPLLNDITDRERESHVEDFFLSTSNELRTETISVTCPAEIKWTTEGNQFSANFETATTLSIELRAFWYVHANGALSYHMSFICPYEHTSRHFFFISMLQKACAPKEFTSEKRDTVWTRGALHCLDPQSGIFPLDNMKVSRDSASAPVTFWAYVQSRFNEHCRDLADELGFNTDSKVSKDYFRSLIQQDDFIEVPGLQMPRARYLFLFHDKTFFQALEREKREQVRDENHECRKINADIDAFIRTAKAEKPRDDKSGITKIPLQPTFLKGLDARPEALKYLFFSGFCQNIIDFLNQDASEILDSLDPIYPAKPEQEDENFFFRFANPRSMTQAVEECRSLNIGNDFIGTCPYAFLVHVASLHNEFLTRSYEKEVVTLKKDVARYTKPEGEKNYKAAAEAFYKFRTKTLADFARFRYANVFRYDTERDCFLGLEKVRGIERRTAYLTETVTNLESTTRDTEERQRQEEAGLRADEDLKREQEMANLQRQSAQLNGLVLIVGCFSILQVLFQIIDYLEKKQKVFAFNFSETYDVLEKVGILLIITTFFLLGLVAIFGFPKLWRWMGREGMTRDGEK